MVLLLHSIHAGLWRKQKSKGFALRSRRADSHLAESVNVSGRARELLTRPVKRAEHAAYALITIQIQIDGL